MKYYILYKNKSFIVPFRKGLKIEEIKSQCLSNFELEEKDINNLILLYVDENMDKIIINNLDELLIFKKGMNSQNFLFELIVEINQEINDMNKLKMKNDNLDEKDKIIIELKKEIENLEKKCENYEKKIKNKINIIESINTINIFSEEDIIKEKKSKKKNENENEIKENNNKINNEFKENKIDKRYNYILEVSKQITDLQFTKTFKLSERICDINDDKNLKNEYPLKFKDIEFIHEKCLLCKKKCENKIYRHYKKKNIYLCENCYKKEIKSQYKDDYFKIKFPEKVLKLKEQRKIRIRIKELGDKPIIDFNNFLNNIFFDKEGNFSKKEINEINDKDFSELKRIYNDMIFIKENPVKYFADYQVTFINKQRMKMDDHEKNLIDKKLKLVLNNLIKFVN